MQGVDVLGQLVPVAIVHDDIIGNGESFGTRGLRGEHVSSGVGIDPIALHHTLYLQLFRAIHHEYPIKIPSPATFGEQRNHMDLVRAGRSS